MFTNFCNVYYSTRKAPAIWPLRYARDHPCKSIVLPQAARAGRYTYLRPNDFNSLWSGSAIVQHGSRQRGMTDKQTNFSRIIVRLHLRIQILSLRCNCTAKKILFEQKTRRNCWNCTKLFLFAGKAYSTPPDQLSGEEGLTAHSENPSAHEKKWFLGLEQEAKTRELETEVSGQTSAFDSSKLRFCSWVEITKRQVTTYWILF